MLHVCCINTATAYTCAASLLQVKVSVLCFKHFPPASQGDSVVLVLQVRKTRGRHASNSLIPWPEAWKADLAGSLKREWMNSMEWHPNSRCVQGKHTSYPHGIHPLPLAQQANLKQCGAQLWDVVDL